MNSDSIFNKRAYFEVYSVIVSEKVSGKIKVYIRNFENGFV